MLAACYSARRRRPYVPPALTAADLGAMLLQPAQHAPSHIGALHHTVEGAAGAAGAVPVCMCATHCAACAPPLAASSPCPPLSCRWLNQAFMWLAIQSEVQDEADKLKEAMQVSLREQEAARLAEASGPPLAKLSEERLRKKFHGSAMLQRLGDVLPGSVLFSDRPALREKVKNKVGRVGVLGGVRAAAWARAGPGRSPYRRRTVQAQCMPVESMGCWLSASHTVLRAYFQALQDCMRAAVRHQSWAVG